MELGADILNLDEFSYDLPDDRIARFPVEPRDSSQLLVYRKGEIQKAIFRDVTDFLPPKSFIVFNNTKVIPARLFFKKPTGAVIEIFLLNPVEPTTIISQVMETTQTCTWACMIGNRKKWKGEVLKAEVGGRRAEGNVEIWAELIDNEANWVKFSWENTSAHSLSFAEIVKEFGKIPLPPYLNREAEDKDLETYQTYYSQQKGAVAAPTAGLHFTKEVFDNLQAQQIPYDFLTLHVGAGTFQPIKVKNVVEHTMHSEQIVFSKSFIINLLKNIEFVIAVGTTSMRSLESLYWFGVNLLMTKQHDFFIEKLTPYKNYGMLPTAAESLQAILNFMQENNIEELIGETEIFIFPSYPFKICRGIITNFHQPHSTLILLIAAFVGKDWRKIYEFALENQFRFLSYGDSSLLIP